MGSTDKVRQSTTQYYLIITLFLLAFIVSGCSRSYSLDKPDQPVDTTAGRELFQQNCRVCHTMQDANAAGTFGPDLDQLQPNAKRVREQIDSGGGGMPADLLTGVKADLVARYIAEVAGTNSGDNEGPKKRGVTKPNVASNAP